DHTGVSHEYTGWPSTNTRQAPHTPIPQPKRVPLRPRWLRNTYSRAVSSSVRMSTGRPFTVTVLIGGGSSCGCDIGDPSFPKRLDEVAMVVAHVGGVLQAERRHVGDELVLIVSDRRNDRIFGLKVDE